MMKQLEPVEADAARQRELSPRPRWAIVRAALAAAALGGGESVTWAIRST